MHIFWAIWQYLYLVIFIVILCFALGWRAQKGKALFCAFCALAVVTSIFDIIWSLLLSTGVLNYDNPLTYMLRVFFLLAAIARVTLLFFFVLIIWSSGRSKAWPVGADSQIGQTAGTAGTDSGGEIGPPIRGVKRAHFSLWLTLAILTNLFFIFGIALVFIGQESYEEGLVIVGGLLCVIGVCLSICLVVLACFYFYRAWLMIPASYARTTPGKAVGYCFIPFFNLYWIFVAIYGWSQDYNRFISETGRTHINRVPEGLFLAHCILTVTGAIPFIGYVVAIPEIIVGIIVFYHICIAINAAADEYTRQDLAASAVTQGNDSQQNTMG